MDEFLAIYLIAPSDSGGKFWEAEVEGTEFRTRYGKYGQDKPWSRKTYPTHHKARLEAEKKARAKKWEGYSKASRPAPVQAGFAGDLAATPFTGTVYFRALDRSPGGNSDLWVIKLTLRHVPGQPVEIVARMHGEFDGARWARGDRRLERDLSDSLPAFLAAAQVLIDAGLTDTSDTILDPRSDREEYDTEWSWIEAELVVGEAPVLRVVQRALSYTSTCSPPDARTAAFLERLQALVGIGRVEAFSDGGSADHGGPEEEPVGRPSPLPLYF